MSDKAAAEYLAGRKLRDIEKIVIDATLKKNGGRRDITADQLGISTRGLINKIGEYGLK
ncbi:MAG: acetoacetate metabolism regulatory protein AtoC [Firmicutes bacterium ADurb.Bin182]|nr:MAG: acetoacetate metabolism regulatory protein AtoC [Firmicutes bacterium ADurb.Bin182]